jgi:serine/threonine-protein kinase
VKLLVSSGPAALDVPKLTGLYLKKAKEEVEKAGFQVGATTWTYNEDRSPYVVLRQDPEAGTKAAKGSKINLVVNEGD